MSNWNPVWKVIIGSVEYTDITISNLTITSGRTDIYSQPVAGYCNLTLINLTTNTIELNINDSLSIQVQDSNGDYVAIYGGTLTDIDVTVNTAGSLGVTQAISIIALGALARLPRLTWSDNLARDYDGDQMYSVLSQYLLGSWNQVSGAAQWSTYDATETWQNAVNIGLGEIDQPGDYELATHTHDEIDVYSLAKEIAISGLGYLYEDPQGRIGYADSTHRGDYLAANGYVELSANDALAAGISTSTRAGDVRNSITIKYGSHTSASISASDPASIAIYGELGQIVDTVLQNSTDAEDQADFYLSLRAIPAEFFKGITYQLANPEVGDQERDALLNVFMGLPINIINLPSNIAQGQFQGFVEGWTFSAGFNTLSITMNVTPVEFSLPAVRWNGVSPAESWDTLGIIDWLNATQVA
jgi:hypothetical protein